MTTHLTILVIDDDRLVAEATARVLRARGHTTHVLYSPAAAHLYYGHVDAVVSDWEMPDGGGARVLAESPVPVVVVSGSDGVVETLCRNGRVALLKPAKALDVDAALQWSVEHARKAGAA